MGEGQVCGTGQGACCAWSNDDCPQEAPICSEYGYCQCSSYQPGGPECGPGFGYANGGQGQEGGQVSRGQTNGGQVCGMGHGACCAGSNDGCPPEAPICSEYGYCQCSSYKPGGPECGPSFDQQMNNVGGGSSNIDQQNNENEYSEDNNPSGSNAENS